MSRIRLLPEAVVNKIAAGEVVERPASVVRELIENSLDAGAKNIGVAVRGAGRREIRVEDDGCGMERDDLILAFERHSTSKLRNFPDLETLSTLGFRGEALPSIAGVSEVRLTSRPADSLAAIRIHIIAGSIRDVSEAGAPPGTVIEVRRLFFNTPARLKFLKTPRTELGHITAEVVAHALASPGVAFSFEREGEKVFTLPAVETLQDRLGDLWGSDSARRLLPLRENEGDIAVSGFIVSPGQAAAVRHGLSLFINRRPVQDRMIAQAVLEGYGVRLPGRRFPSGVISIDLAGTGVDVNIHPAKREVRFSRPDRVRRLVVRAVAGALKSSFPASSASASGSGRPVGGVGERAAAYAPGQEEMNLGQKWSGGPLPGGETEPAAGPGLYRVLGQAGNRYVLAQTPEGVVIIDQHAAHERVVYERFREAFRKDRIEVQPLLAPINVDLTPTRAALLAERIPLFKDLGIEIEPFGRDSFIITALPAILSSWNREELVLDVISRLDEQKGGPADPREEIIIRLSCLAAVKARERLEPVELSRLVEELYACAEPGHCPHGRPTMLIHAWEDLEKRFGRR
ncbi:MAG: DNA mismatch repair endonuclease MutL [PVC group bacterium]